MAQPFFQAPARSAAIQIVKPPSADSTSLAPGPGTPAKGLAAVADVGVGLSPVVAKGGYGRGRNAGGADGNGVESPAPGGKRVGNAQLLPIREPPALEKTSSGMGLGAAAPAFVPKTPLNDTASPTTSAASLQPQWPVMQGQEGLLGMDMSVSGMQSGSARSSSSAQLGYDDSMGMDTSLGLESMYLAPQHIRQPLDYNLYTSPLSSTSNPPLTAHPLHSFFIPDDLRRYLTARNDAQWFPTSGSFPGLPHEIGVYHSLIPLDPPRPAPPGALPAGHPGSRVYMHPAPAYRARSTVDGSVYVLRRIEGYKLVNEAAFGAIDIWRRMRHPNIVGLREAFTTKGFGDNSLVLVYDYHPDSSTVLEEHLHPEPPALSMGRRRTGMPIPERVLWSYITQIANALKAIHSSGLAARNMDPSKVLITGKNRIRLNGCGILDVLAYDASTPVGVFQQEDLVSFGKLVISLCCEFFTPGQHPGPPLEHIARNYSPDVKNLVMFLISKPGPLKTIDDVIRMLGARILNEMDAAQNYVDVLEGALSTELENARLVRLMTKLGFINERAEFEHDPRWSDTGDRYVVKLFRDYVFHSVGMDGRAILDMSHVVTCLNKLDAGLDEKIMLVSRDDHSCLVASYRDIKACIESAFNELKTGGGNLMGAGMMMMR